MYGLPLFLEFHWGLDLLVRDARHFASRFIAALFFSAGLLSFGLFALQVLPMHEDPALLRFALIPLRLITALLGVRLVLFLSDWPKSLAWQRGMYVLFVLPVLEMLRPPRFLVANAVERHGFWVTIMTPSQRIITWVSVFIILLMVASLARARARSRRPNIRGRLQGLIWSTLALAGTNVLFGLLLMPPRAWWFPPYSSELIGGVVWIFTLRLTVVRYALVPSQSERYKNWFDRHPNALILTESTGRVVDMNEAAVALVGPSPRYFRQALPQDTGEHDWERYASALKAGVAVTNWEQQIQDAGRHTRIASVDAEVLDVGHGRYWAFVLRDVTSERRRLDQTTQLAFTDPLTGVGNALTFRQHLDEVLTRRPVDPAAVIFLDLDDFKQINDSYGHLAGDRALTHVAERLAPLFRPGDVVARLGGDEFVILLQNTRDLAVSDVLDRIVRELSRPMVTPDWPPITVRASIGLARYPEDGIDPETLLHRADSAMYEAKRAGKNQYRIFGIPERRTDDAKEVH